MLKQSLVTAWLIEKLIFQVNYLGGDMELLDDPAARALIQVQISRIFVNWLALTEFWSLYFTQLVDA